MGKALFIFLLFSTISYGAENILLVAGGYEGSQRNFLFNSTSNRLVQTMTARGWEASAIYGEEAHAQIHQEEFSTVGISNHAPFSVAEFRRRIDELVRGEGPAQLFLHLAGHGTIDNGRFRVQVGPDSYLYAKELAQILEPLLSKGVKVALTLDSCSSGHIIENLNEHLGALTSNLCTVASTNREPYVSSRGIIGQMMRELQASQGGSAISLENLYRSVRQEQHFTRPRENLFPQISSLPNAIDLSSSGPSLTDEGGECSEDNVEIIPAEAEIILGPLRTSWDNVQRTCTQDVRQPDGSMSYRGQYSDQCRDSLPTDSFENNIVVSSANYPGIFESREGRITSVRSGTFEENVRFFPEFESASNSARISSAGICLLLLDDRVELSNRERLRLQRLIGDKFLNRCRAALERSCCHYNFQKFVDLERTHYEAYFESHSTRGNVCRTFHL